MHHYRDIESEDYYDMACEWIKHRNYVKAEEYLQRSISLNPNFVYAYITLAGLYARRKNYHNAIQVLRKASGVDPAFDRIDYLMARYAFKCEDYRNAIRYIDRAIETNPKELYLLVKELLEERFQGQRH